MPVYAVFSQKKWSLDSVPWDHSGAISGTIPKKRIASHKTKLSSLLSFYKTELSDQELTEARNFKDFLDIFAYIDHMEILFPGKTLVHYHHDSKTGR